MSRSTPAPATTAATASTPTTAAIRQNTSSRLTAPLRRRWQHWWLARLVPSALHQLTQRNIYIVPTRAGWMLALTLLVLLITSINFQLNLGYVLTFLLAGCAMAGLYLCHHTLRGLSLQLHPPEPHFVGQPVALQVQLNNGRKSPRYALGLAVKLLDEETPITQSTTAPPHPTAWVHADVGAQASETVQLSCQPQRRGWNDLPCLTIETRFPLGTMRAWSHWRPSAQVLMFPAPESNAPALPAGEWQAASGRAAHARGNDSLDGVRAYRRGDPLKYVVWKKAAQALATGSGALVSRDAQALQHQSLWLDLAHTGLSHPEARLSRLCAWVLRAETLGVDYGLRLGSQQITPGQGAAHQRQCLDALALYGERR